MVCLLLLTFITYALVSYISNGSGEQLSSQDNGNGSAGHSSSSSSRVAVTCVSWRGMGTFMTVAVSSHCNRPNLQLWLLFPCTQDSRHLFCLPHALQRMICFVGVSDRCLCSSTCFVGQCYSVCFRVIAFANTVITVVWHRCLLFICILACCCHCQVPVVHVYAAKQYIAIHYIQCSMVLN